jgi:predicted  nucleic acid-binding Zn-ribbon protein
MHLPFSHQTDKDKTDLLRHIPHLETTNASLAHTNTFLTQQITTLRSTVTALRTENETQRIELLTLEEEADELEDDVEYLMGELDEWRERIEQQTIKMQATMKDVFEAQKRESDEKKVGNECTKVQDEE